MAADELFRQPGYVAVSVEQLAGHAGVTRKTFYKHFPSKRDVGLDWAKRRWSGVSARWMRLKDGDPADPVWVKSWIEELFDYYENNSEIRSLSTLSMEEPAVGDWQHDRLLKLIDELGTTVSRFDIPDTAPDAALRIGREVLIFSQLMEQCALYALGRSRFERSVLVPLLTERFLG